MRQSHHLQIYFLLSTIKYSMLVIFNILDSLHWHCFRSSNFLQLHTHIYTYKMIQLTTFRTKLCLKFSNSSRAKCDTHSSCNSQVGHSLSGEVRTNLHEAQHFSLVSQYICICPTSFPTSLSTHLTHPLPTPNSDSKIQVMFT